MVLNSVTNCMEQSSSKTFSDFQCMQLDSSPIIIIIIIIIIIGFKYFQTVLLWQKYCMRNWL